MFKLKLLLLLLITPLFAIAGDPMQPFHAEYQLFHGEKQRGSGYYKLQQLEDGHYSMGYQSKGSFMFLTDTRTENSRFSFVDGQLVPDNYTMQRKGTGPDFKASVEFRAHDNKIIANYKKEEFKLNWQEKTFDPLLYQQQLRLDVAAGKTDMKYLVAYKTRLRNYHYQVLTTEMLKLNIGEYEAIKVQRIRGEGSSKSTLLWFIPELDYILGKMSHFEDGELKANLILSKVR